MIFNSKDTMVKGILMAALLIAMGAHAMAIEEPSYRILETEGEFELQISIHHRISWPRLTWKVISKRSEVKAFDIWRLHRGKKPKKGIHFNDCPSQPEASIRKNCHDCPSQPSTGKWSVANSIHDAVHLHMDTLPS
jgi:hypothetical protein